MREQAREGVGCCQAACICERLRGRPTLERWALTAPVWPDKSSWQLKLHAWMCEPQYSSMAPLPHSLPTVLGRANITGLSLKPSGRSNVCLCAFVRALGFTSLPSALRSERG